MSLKPGTPDQLEIILAPVEHPICRDLCRFFAANGWDIDISGPHNAFAMMPSGYGEGPASIDLWEMTAWLINARIRRET